MISMIPDASPIQMDKIPSTMFPAPVRFIVKYYELADYLIAKIRDDKYSPEAAIGEAEVKGWPFKTHICASTAYNYIRGEIFGDELTA